MFLLILTVFIRFGNFVEALSELLVELHGIILAQTHGWGQPRVTRSPGYQVNPGP